MAIAAVAALPDEAWFRTVEGPARAFAAGKKVGCRRFRMPVSRRSEMAMDGFMM
tara:strand:- start:2395 stop:2556 length:162 start_codon:yes stop_codon:yes gene_type:complete